MTVTILTVAGNHQPTVSAMNLAHLTRTSTLIDPDCPIVYLAGSLVVTQRNGVVRQALTESTADWFLILDSDHVYPTDLIEQLHTAATTHNADIVGVATVSWQEDSRVARPTVYDRTDDGSYQIRYDLPASFYIPGADGELLEVSATGTGCLLVARRVFETLQSDRDWPWFDQPEREDGTRIGEDIWFCEQAWERGFRVHVHTGIKVGHVKQIVVWPSDVKGVPQVGVVIPTFSNLRGLRVVVDALRVDGGWQKLVVCNNGHDRELTRWLYAQDDIHVVNAQGLCLHEMWNEGARVVLGEFPDAHVAFLNDDVVPGPRMLPRLTGALLGHRDLWVVSPNYDRRTIDGRGDVQLTEDICAGRYDGTGGLAGFAFLTDNQLWRAGWSWPVPPRWWFGDNLLVGAVSAAGKLCGVTTVCSVTHDDDDGGTDWLDPDHPRYAEVQADIAWWDTLNSDVA